MSCETPQLVSAIANLIDNAVKYSDAGATVRVSAKGDDAEVSISVRDRGIGIPATDPVEGKGWTFTLRLPVLPPPTER